MTVGAAPSGRRGPGLAARGREDDNGCPARPTPETRYPAEGFGDNLAVSVCVYTEDEAGPLRRTWTEKLGAEEADRLVRGVAARRATPAANLRRVGPTRSR